MSVALLIHRPPTPPQPADKSLSNRLHTSAAPLQPPNKKAQFPCLTKSAETTATANSASATITTHSAIKQKLQLKYLSSTLFNSEKSSVLKRSGGGGGDRKRFNFFHFHLEHWL